MRNERTEQTKEQTKVLQPIVAGMPTVTQVMHSGPSETDAMTDPAPGQVLAIRVGANGQELKGSAFYIGEATYNKFYASKPGFAIKKKAK